MARYYTQLNANPHFSLRLVSTLIKRATREGIAYETENAFILDGIRYGASFEPQKGALTLRWTEEGRQHIQTIGIVGKPCNIHSLSGAYVYYFVCPLTNTKCRVLYKTIGDGFCGRKALPKALYPLQMNSHRTRYINYPPDGQQPYRRNGKTHYRGRLTPYGKRCQRHEQAVNRQEEAFALETSRLLSKR